MGSEVKAILKYNRMQAGWLCPYCETENTYGAGRCMLCGGVRDTNATYLQPGVIQEMAPISYTAISSSTGASTPKPSSDKSDNWGAMLAIGIGVAVFIFILFVALANA